MAYENLQGVHYLLAVSPVLVTFLVIYGLSVLVLGPMRHWFEGYPYNACYSSTLGDIALTLYVLVGVKALRTGGMTIWFGDISMQVMLAALCLSVGMVWQRFVVFSAKGKRGTVADAYHNIFVVAMFAYFIALLLPVLWSAQWMSAWGCIGFWGATIAIDGFIGSLDQGKYRDEKGVTLPCERLNQVELYTRWTEMTFGGKWMYLKLRSVYDLVFGSHD